MKKLLITGGRGFFGTRLAEYWKDTFECILTDKDELDITDREAVQTFFERVRPDYVVHAAAIAVTKFCDEHPDIARQINVEGAINVAESTKAVAGKLVFLSTEQVFNGNTNRGPYSEEDEAIPSTVYGANKLEAEQRLRLILDELWIIRFTWMFGFPERNSGMAGNIFWDTIASILKGEKIKAPLNEHRGMTYVYEMIEQFGKVFDLPYGTYHFGSENALNRYEIVVHLIENLGLAHRLEDLVQPDSTTYAVTPRDIRLSTEKARQHGIHFSSSSEAIERCVREYGLRLP